MGCCFQWLFELGEENFVGFDGILLCVNVVRFQGGCDVGVYNDGVIVGCVVDKDVCGVGIFV